MEMYDNQQTSARLDWFWGCAMAHSIPPLGVENCTSFTCKPCHRGNGGVQGKAGGGKDNCDSELVMWEAVSVHDVPALVIDG